MKNNRLQAVHDDDLSNLLMSLGVYESVQNGKCSCLFCQKVITFDNAGNQSEQVIYTDGTGYFEVKDGSLSFNYGSKIKVSDIAVCHDLSLCNLSFLNEIDTKKSGKDKRHLP